MMERKIAALEREQAYGRKLGLEQRLTENEIEAAYFLSCLYNRLLVYIGSTGVMINGRLMIRNPVT